MICSAISPPADNLTGRLEKCLPFGPHKIKRDSRAQYYVHGAHGCLSLCDGRVFLFFARVHGRPLSSEQLKDLYSTRLQSESSTNLVSSIVGLSRCMHQHHQVQYYPSTANTVRGSLARVSWSARPVLNNTGLPLRGFCVTSD